MPKTAETHKTDFLEAYNELNNKRKEELKRAFEKQFDYSETSSTFYRKIAFTTPVWSIEREFFQKHLKKELAIVAKKKKGATA